MTNRVPRLASLRYAQRMRLIQLLSDQLRQRLTTQKGRLRWNILAVGCGTKTKGGRLIAGRPPCVKIVVRDKIPGYRYALEQEVQLRHGGKTYRVLTDVEVFDARKFRLQARIDTAAEVRAGEVGSLGFVMQDAAANRYVVSAAHVLRTSATTWRKGQRDGNGDMLAACRYPPGPTGAGVFDAAPAQVTRLGPIAAPPSVPYGDVVTSWAGALQVANVVICGKHGVVPATVAFRVPSLEETNPVLERILFCQLTDNLLTADGDSGAPILTQSGGRLVGIHLGIYPDPADSPPPYYSLGHVAGDLFDQFSALMGKSLGLWRP